MRIGWQVGGVVAALIVGALVVDCGSDTTSGGSGFTTSGTGANGAGGTGTGASAGNGFGGLGGNGTGGSATGGSATGGNGSGGLPPPTEIAECQGHVYACGNLLDDDGDGLVDYQDPDCLGPCDDTEDSYFGGISGQAGPKCIVDCYWDQDSGPGNDDCYWNHQCDPHEVAPDYYPEAPNGMNCAYDPSANTPGTSATCDELYQKQSDACLAYCGPLTPNGCDCFGCCELPSGSGKFVWVGSDDDGVQANGGTCDLASVDDPTKCQPCLPVAGCFNPCDKCELCIGKYVLPPECNPQGSGGGGTGGSGTGGGGGSGQCPGGEQPCGLPNQPLCPGGFFCITGCCQPVPT